MSHVDLEAAAVLVGPMNIATTRGLAKGSLSLPNILTFARIAAIPIVVGCIYAQAILDCRCGCDGSHWPYSLPRQ